MQIKNSFRVPLPVDRAWETLLDVPTVARCMPGARLLDTEGDDTYLGEVSVRLGPVTLSFKGRAQIVERDAQARTAKVKAQGRDTKGRGSANAEVNFALAEDDGGTRVGILTDLNLSGAVAQYGRGAAMISDLSEHLVGEFARNLQAELGTEKAPETAAAPAEETGEQTTTAVQAESGSGDAAGKQSQPAAAPLSGIKLLVVIIRGFFGRLFSRRERSG